MRLRVVVCAVLGLTLASGDATTDPCPESCVFGLCSTRARRDTTIVGGPFSYTTANAGYDCVAGHVSISFDTGDDGCASASATARDRFTLVGPSSPSPLSFTVALHLVGWAAQNIYSSTIAGSLGEGSNTPVSAGATASYPNNSVFLDQTLSLDLFHPVGEPFELTCTASGYACGLSRGSVSGTLSFPNLPSAYGVTSCQGYSTGTVVPTFSRTWGQVKSLYR